VGFWPSTKLNRAVKQTADVTEGTSTNPVDVPGMSLYIPRAGTYYIFITCPFSCLDATARNHGSGLSYTGTTTSMSIGSGPTLRQTTMGTLPVVTGETVQSSAHSVFGRIVVSTPGTLKWSFSRSANTITHTDGIMFVSEV
jgi:hypothetical protein